MPRPAGRADKPTAIAYDRAMAERPPRRRAQRLSSRKATQAALEPPIPAPAMAVATDLPSRFAGRRPSWAVFAVLTIVATLLAATLALLADLARAPRPAPKPSAVA